ncbi:MAG: 1-acyl-sn-glycerol-3-phosphate acyltransferase [Bacilli bacterium]|nr:1-acyl-sn-glycerol-3-phosphate acyltransferase [Bacilli bacterium]
MKKEKDLHAELAKRKYKIPNPLIYFIYWAVDTTHLLGGKYHPHIVIQDDINKCKGPCFLIWNHQSRRDHAFLTLATYPRRLSIVAEYVSFFREHLHWPFKMMKILPKKVFCNDLVGVRAMRDIIKQGGCVAFSPEGTSSIFGDNQPIVPGTGRFLQVFNIPVYSMALKGSYLTNNKVSIDDRIGQVFGTLKLLFTPEDLKKMSADEIEAKINEEFHHDDYEWNKTARIKYKAKEGITKNLSDICYKCPKCGHEFVMKDHDNIIECSHCGNGATMDEYYDFHPFDDTCIIPESPSSWAHEERQDIIDEIRKDKNYSWSFHVKLGYIPKDHWIKKTDMSEICGEGIYTIDHQGVHFKGTKLGEPFSFDVDYKTVQTYPMSIDLSVFSLFVNEVEYDFYPDDRIVAKAIMVTEEMHRLHINKWKNFPWFDYMYEGKELGIDLKK